MKDVVAIFLVLALIGMEVVLWAVNPMHIPAIFVPDRALGIQVFQELGQSMEPSVPAGRYVMITAWPYWKGEPKTGDIVAFQYPINPSIVDLKRVVATAGATVEIRAGITYIDGKADSEPWLDDLLEPTSSFDMPPVRVPRDSYFVMGDNRDRSQDSRDYGPIARERIIGVKWP